MSGESSGVPLVTALRNALESVQTRPEDVAVVTLAETYAAAIGADPDLETLEKLGPKLLAALVELRMTPKARVALAKGVQPGGSESSEQRSKLDELRDRRDKRARANGTAPVDPAP